MVSNRQIHILEPVAHSSPASCLSSPLRIQTAPCTPQPDVWCFICSLSNAAFYPFLNLFIHFYGLTLMWVTQVQLPYIHPSLIHSVSAVSPSLMCAVSLCLPPLCLCVCGSVRPWQHSFYLPPPHLGTYCQSTQWLHLKPDPCSLWSFPDRHHRFRPWPVLLCHLSLINKSQSSQPYFIALGFLH